MFFLEVKTYSYSLRMCFLLCALFDIWAGIKWPTSVVPNPMAGAPQGCRALPEAAQNAQVLNGKYYPFRLLCRSAPWPAAGSWAQHHGQRRSGE